MATADATKIHIGQGEIFLGGTAPAAGADLNDPTSSSLNAATTAWEPVSGGTYVGFTNGPATLTYRPTFYMVETEQAFSEVVTSPTAEETTLAFTALQSTAANIQAGFSQATTETNAGPTPPANSAIFVGSKTAFTTQVVSLISRKRTAAGYFILTIYKGYSAEGSALNFERRRETQVGITIRAQADLTRPVGDQLFQLVDYTANPV